MTIVKKIQIFSNINGVSDYLKININFAQYMQNIFNYIETEIDREPFSSNLLFPTTDTTINGVSYVGSSTPSTPIADTSLTSFTTKIMSELNVFNTACSVAYQTLLVQKMKPQPNFDFITTTFYNAQIRFLKNVVNYFSMFLFIINMTTLPTLQNATQVVSSELQTLFTNQQIVLSNSEHLLNTNIRNMSVSIRPYYYHILSNITDTLQELFILNENIFVLLLKAD